MYQESGRIEREANLSDEYVQPSRIPVPQHVGYEGESCSTDSNCHERLVCQKGVCGQWAPTLYKKEFSKDSNGVSSKEGFNTAKPSTPQAEETIRYTSKRRANSGKNYYSYD